MTYSFNLLEEPWIPCRMIDGERQEMNLSDALCQAHEITEIMHPSPLVTISLHRLLLAVLHRIFGPSDWRAWKAIWEERRFEEEKVKEYLNHWKERFDLFHEEHPFYQTSEIPFEKYETTAGLLSFSPPYRSHPTLFDHSLANIPPSLCPAEAALFLLVQQAFAYVNLVTYENKQHKSANAAPLLRSAVVLHLRDNVFETLMLNLHAYNADDELPFHFDAEKDKPAWEREEAVKPEERLPYGYLDWLTWQSRRIRLKAETDNNENLIIRKVVLMKGFQLPKGKWRKHYETMIPFQVKKNAKKDEEPWPPVEFEESKSLWRDSMSLLQSIPEKRDRPKMVDWLADLKMANALPRILKMRLAVFGLSADQAKPEFWRSEVLPLDIQFYHSQELVDALSNALKLAEKAGDTIAARMKTKVKQRRGSPRDRWLWGVGCVLMLPDKKWESYETPEISEDQEKRIRDLEKHVAPQHTFWPRLETPFKQLLEQLPEDKSTDQYGSTVYGTKLLPAWADTIRQAAQEAFDIAADAIGESPRAFKARAKAESVFRKLLNSVLKPYTENHEKGGEEA